MYFSSITQKPSSYSSPPSREAMDGQACIPNTPANPDRTEERNAKNFVNFEPEERIGLSTSILPRWRSTTELLRRSEEI